MENTSCLYKYRYASKMVKGKKAGRWVRCRVIKNRRHVFSTLEDNEVLLYILESHANQYLLPRVEFLHAMLEYNTLMSPSMIRHCTVRPAILRNQV